MDYKVVGYEHKEGISKKTNKPYCIDIVHCIVEHSIMNIDGYGDRVESIIYNALVNGPLEAVPAVGTYVDIRCSRTGYITDIVPVEN